MKLKKLTFLLTLITLSKLQQEASSTEPQILKFLSETKDSNHKEKTKNNNNEIPETSNLNIQNQIQNIKEKKKTLNTNLTLFSSIFLPHKKIITTTATKNKNQPIAIFHGIGDDCNGWMQTWTKYLSAAADTYAKCVESGANKDSEFISTQKQAEKACLLINQDKNFSGNFIIVAFSQGGLIGRHILQQCEMQGKVTKFISLGTPHMGISRVPWAEGPLLLKRILDYAINLVAFIPGINNFYSPLSYLNPPLMHELYRKYGSFLSVLNNEAYDEKFNLKFKSRFENLEKLVLIKFKEDDIVFPKESAWFQRYDENYQLQNLQQNEFYLKDFLGLKALNEAGKVDFFEFQGKHMQLTSEQMDKFVVPALLDE